EAVDHAALEVVGQQYAGVDPGKRDGLDEDPGHQEVDVLPRCAALPPDLDRPAEDEVEEQHEHDRAERHVEQELGRAPDVDQVALDHLPGIGDPGHRRGMSRRRARRRGSWPRAGDCAHAPTASRSWAAASASAWISASGCWPVRTRKTSSNVGRWTPASSTATPAASSSRTARVRMPSPPATGTLTWRA